MSRPSTRGGTCWKIYFVDNDAAKDGLIKKYSPSSASNELIEAFWSLEASMGSYAWLERVPSKSNPADAPSRADFEALKAQGAVRDTPCLPDPWKGAIVRFGSELGFD